MKRYAGFIIIFIAVIIFLGVLYTNGGYLTTTRPFSSYTILTSSWEKYKDQFINMDGRVIDYSQNAVTTSEGQSYALLRAVWVDDKNSFDLIWKWTKENLKRKTDNLFAWQWRTTGREENSAADADTDIALALIFAHNRWRQGSYLDEAKNIIADIWKLETGTVKSKKRYVVAGNWAQDNTVLVINPSYFAPYAYRIFATVDTDKNRDWESLIDPVYDLWEKSTTTGLPPDWISVSKTTETINPTNNPNLTTNYSYDAMRIPFRAYLDYYWYGENRAYNYLKKYFTPLSRDFEKNGAVYSSYFPDGSPINTLESPAMYGTAMGYFLIENPDLAKKIYEEKIIRLYSNDSNSFNENIPYYDQNWLWFGAGIYNNFLRRL